LVTRQEMDLPAANDFVLIWVRQPDISRKMLVCALWVFFWPTARAAAIRTFPNHRAKVKTAEASSVSFTVFIVLRQERNEILRNDIESYRDKYIAQYSFKAKIYRKNIDLRGSV